MKTKNVLGKEKIINILFGHDNGSPFGTYYQLKSLIYYQKRLMEQSELMKNINTYEKGRYPFIPSYDVDRYLSAALSTLGRTNKYSEIKSVDAGSGLGFIPFVIVSMTNFENA